MGISIIVVTYNSMKYLPDFMESIFNQTYFTDSQETPDVLVIDNASHDETVCFIRDHYPTVKMLRNVNNIGLSKAWNQGIKMTSGEYILIMNPDLVLDKNFLEESVKIINNNNNIASVGGKLYQLKVESDGDMHMLDKTNILDSCGIKAFKNRRFIERGAGEVDYGQYDEEEEVFGISGALGLYRRSALEQVRYGEEYFDEDFFMYKEDIDMGWRLRLAGWISVYNPKAIGYHHRRAKSQNGRVKNLSIVKHRRSKEDFVNFHSYKNHWLLLYKNSLSKNFIKDFIYILFYELKKLMYVLIFEFRTLHKSLRALWKLRKKMKKKREFNMKIKKIDYKEINKWFK